MKAERFVLHLGDPEYPALLAETPQPPRTLYGLGDPTALEPGVAVIGARRATPSGRSSARLFAGWAARAGYIVASGAAIGCDQAAHLAALDEGGRTVAVLAGGPDVAYPRSASKLLARIACSEGAVVSEHPWGTEPRRWAFRTRNRIIAGLSRAVLVVEAGLPSGTFTTAEDALDAGREVLAVPGSIHSPEARGPNRLIRTGATPITDISELRVELEALLGPARLDSVGPRLMSPGPRAGDGDRARMVDPVLAAVQALPMRPDDLARELQTDIATIASRLGILETQGWVRRFPDGRYGPVHS